MIAFDSGALVALFKAENGAARVRQLLVANKNKCVIHAVNLLEVRYNFERERGADYADRVVDLVNRMGIETRGDFDGAFLSDAAFLKVNCKMSLADTFAVALARRLNGPLVSTDHHEFDAVHAAGICTVEFIR